MKLYMNLQLFADAEKTEKPTPKRRRDARQEGQVLQSKEVSSVFILLIGIVCIKLLSDYSINRFMNFFNEIYSNIGNVDEFFDENNLMVNFLKVLTSFISLAGPIIAVTTLAALVISYLQVGFLFTTKTLGLKLNRINPVEGFKRLFSKRALVELVKSILKIPIIGYVAYSFVKKNFTQILNLPFYEPKSLFVNFADLGFDFAIRVLAAYIVIAFLDYFFQWRQHEKSLMMTKQEIKEEYKQTEGDPLIKSKIREKQRRIAMARMMQEVPKADVIITNPTHIAVAIKYDKDLYKAPYVVAKGADLIAENIKKVAKENSVPIVENKPLARMLYDTLEIGDLIPEELYEAIAEVLAYVYTLKENY